MPGYGLVSVVIPTYRRAVELRLAVKSVLAQTHAELEVMVVSDGPDEAARAAVEGLDGRVQYLELETNSGPAAARNVGVAASRGEWLCFLDDDDTMLPRRVEAALALADEDAPKQMVACRAVYRRGVRDDVWPAHPIAEGEDVADYILRRPSLLGRPGVLPLQTLLVHRSMLAAVPFATHADHEDWAWLLEAWHGAGARVVFVWEALVVYNIATESLSRSRRMNWRESLAWAEMYRGWMSAAAFNSFLATKVALKAKRAGDWRGLWVVARAVLRNRPGMLDVLFVVGVALLPNGLLQGVWKRSLRNDGGAR